MPYVENRAACSLHADFPIHELFGIVRESFEPLSLFLSHRSTFLAIYAIFHLPIQPKDFIVVMGDTKFQEFAYI